MGNFNRERSGSGSRSGGFGGGNRRGSFGRDGGRPELFRATCAKCGDSCEVPFRPSSDKPVYCSDCFRGMDNARGERDFGGRSDRGDRGNRGGRDFSDRGDKTMHKAICDDCGKECEVPFKPSSDKPIYCSDCFMKGDKSKSKKSDNSKLDFDTLNAKLDLIIKFFKISNTKKEDTPKKEEIKKVIKEEPKEVIKPKKVAPTKEKKEIKKVEKTEKKVVAKKKTK